MSNAKYDPINSDLFIENRKKFIAQMEPNSIAIFTSNDVMPRSADGYHGFRQNSDIFYLSGIDQEESYLVLYPDNPNEKMREVLFLRKTNEHIAVWEGYKYTQAHAVEVSGVEKVIWNTSFESLLAGMVFNADNIYLNWNEHGRFSTEVPYKDVRFVQYMKEKFPLHNFRRSAPIMHHLRAVKSEIEINLMRIAVSITGKAFNRVMKFIKPGVWEHEIEAEIQHEYLWNRATGPAYDSIIASGNNANVLHYVANNQQCMDGDVILMDFGAEYANYAADLTRSIPVNGRFTERQRAVYNAVLHVMKEATSMLRPGTLHEEYHKEVGKVMEAELLKLGLLSKEDIKNQSKDRPAYKKYFMHGTSHHLGLDVHDVGNRSRPFEAGMVFTVEPGIYIPEEKLGIRIENDVVVTNGEPLDLMEEAGVIREADEIEAYMNDN